MPKIKVSVNPEAKSAFADYDGPTPPVGSGYAGVIKNVRLKQANSGNLYLNVLVEHKATDKADHKKFDGAPQWVRVMFGEHEETQARLTAFLKAATNRDRINVKEVDIVDTDEEARTGTGSVVKTIDGVKPDGKPVLFNIRQRAAQDGYDATLEADMIRRPRNVDAAPATEVPAEEVDEDDIEVEGDEEETEEDGQTREERAAELKKEALADLKAAAAAAEIDIKGLKKAEIIEAILDWEFEDAAEEEADEDDEEEEELDEEELEAEEDEEEEEEEDEDDVDLEAELREELAGLDRAALKTRVKEANSEFKIFKSTTDDAIRDAIVAAEISEPPF